MKSIYMAIWYRCNQACKGCPCTQNVDKKKNMTFEDVKALTEKALQNSDEPIAITVSGGEPTLHPEFMKIMRYFQSKDVYVTILTNAEKFHNIEFCEEFLSNISILRTRIVTTIHSSHPETARSGFPMGYRQKSASTWKESPYAKVEPSCRFHPQRDG